MAKIELLLRLASTIPGIAITVGLLIGSPAVAQCLLCSAPSQGEATASAAEDSTPLQIEVTADLDFSRIVAGGTGGSISIDAASGHSSTSGNVSALSGFGFSGHVLVTGAPGRSIRIELPDSVDLVSGQGGHARVEGIVASVPTIAQLGPDGRLEFGFGGRLQLDGSSEGDFRGRVQVTVSYE